MASIALHRVADLERAIAHAHTSHDFVTDNAVSATVRSEWRESEPSGLRGVELRAAARMSMGRSAKLALWAMFSLLAGPELTGCRGFTLCGRPGVTTGQFTRAKTSLAYITRAVSDPSHVACRAEAIIPATLGFMLENETELCNHTGVCAQRNGPDTVITPNTYLRRPETTSQGGLRALGIGRGVDADDCGKTATEACNEAVDYFFMKQSDIRPPTVVCTLAADRIRCESAPVEVGPDSDG